MYLNKYFAPQIGCQLPRRETLALFLHLLAIFCGTRDTRKSRCKQYLYAVLGELLSAFPLPQARCTRVVLTAFSVEYMLGYDRIQRWTGGRKFGAYSYVNHIRIANHGRGVQYEEQFYIWKATFLKFHSLHEWYTFSKSFLPRQICHEAAYFYFKRPRNNIWTVTRSLSR